LEVTMAAFCEKCGIGMLGEKFDWKATSDGGWHWVWFEWWTSTPQHPNCPDCGQEPQPALPTQVIFPNPTGKGRMPYSVVVGVAGYPLKGGGLFGTEACETAWKILPEEERVRMIEKALADALKSVR
jgi:hypothetical protein